MAYVPAQSAYPPQAVYHSQTSTQLLHHAQSQYFRQTPYGQPAVPPTVPQQPVPHLPPPVSVPPVRKGITIKDACSKEVLDIVSISARHKASANETRSGGLIISEPKKSSGPIQIKTPPPKNSAAPATTVSSKSSDPRSPSPNAYHANEVERTVFFGKDSSPDQEVSKAVIPEPELSHGSTASRQELPPHESNGSEHEHSSQDCGGFKPKESPKESVVPEPEVSSRDGDSIKPELLPQDVFTAEPDRISQVGTASKDEVSQESDASKPEALSQEGDSSSEDEEQSPDESSPPAVEKSDASESNAAGTIRKYSRDQLIAIKIAANSSASSANVPQSLVSVGNSNLLRSKPRLMHKAHNRRVINFDTSEVALDDVENAFKPSHLKAEDGSVDRVSQLSKELNIILNRLLDDNISEVAMEVKQLSMKGEAEIGCLVKAITTKVHIDNVNAQIDEKIKGTNDEKVKKMLEEDRETAVSKKRDAFFGIMQFFSYLYVNKVISPKSVSDSLKSLVKPKSQDDVLALVTCLTICGEQMDRNAMPILSECIAGLEAAKNDLKMEQYVRYKITTLIELKERNWKKLEVARPPSAPSQGLSRSGLGKDDMGRRVSTLSSMRKIGDSQALIDTKSLAVSNLPNRSNYLGPQYDWRQGSKAQPKLQKSGATSESENGKDSRASSTSANKRGANQSSQLKIDENLTAKEAIRDAIDAFTNSDTPEFDLLLRESEKKAFVRDILCKALDGKNDVRRLIVRILAHLYNKHQISDPQMEFGFTELVSFSDEVDCPKLGEYYGELVSPVITASTLNLDKVISLIGKLPEDSDKLDGLAQCLKLASERVGEPAIVALFNKGVASGITWGVEKAFKDSDFLRRFHLEFLAAGRPSLNAAKQWRGSPQASSTNDRSVSGRIDECLRKMKLDELTSVCSENSKSKDAEKYLKQIFEFGKSSSKKDLGCLASVVKLFSASSPDGEKGLILALQNSVDKNEDYFVAWLEALVQRKVLFPRSVNAYCQDKRAASPFKEAAQRVARSYKY
ncbi:unnamed protein product [Mesocestoides corti]|uniref:MIF4G domain-containing protein n=1 Tax=Mesocestoides corti TaxID=53468 RepID=A0A0R3U1I5_MESCO|nr:unnamed protein product [Mesocestoides corti]